MPQTTRIHQAFDADVVQHWMPRLHFAAAPPEEWLGDLAVLVPDWSYPEHWAIDRRRQWVEVGLLYDWPTGLYQAR